mgnify:CR=1 FL=1
MIANQLKIFRKNNNISADEMAKAINAKPSTIYNYENGYSKPNVDVLNILIEKYNLNINWLLTGKGSMFLENKNTFELKQKNIDYQNFNNRLCTLIEKSELDLKTFAGVVDIKFERLADLCVGKKPTIDEIISIVECFNITTDYLLLGIE